MIQILSHPLDLQTDCKLYHYDNKNCLQMFEFFSSKGTYTPSAI